MATSQGDTYPATTAKSRGQTIYRYNIHAIQDTDEPGGEPRTAYAWDEVWITGKVTKAKVLAAMRAAAREDDDSDIGDAATQYMSARDALKATKVKILPVPQLSEAVALILDYLGIEYDGTA